MLERSERQLRLYLCPARTLTGGRRSFDVCERRSARPSSHVEQQELAVGRRADRDVVLVGDRGSVAGSELLAVDRDRAVRELHPAPVRAVGGMSDLVACTEQCRVEIRSLMDDDG